MREAKSHMNSLLMNSENEDGTVNRGNILYYLYNYITILNKLVFRVIL